MSNDENSKRPSSWYVIGLVAEYIERSGMVNGWTAVLVSRVFGRITGRNLLRKEVGRIN